MVTLAIKFSFLFINFVKNFHLALPAFIDKIVELVLTETGKTSFEWQVSADGFSIDVIIGPGATTTPAPGSIEVKSVPSGTIVPAPTTVTQTAPTPTVDGNSLDAPADPSDPGGPVI